MIPFGELTWATFLARDNRFRATVSLDGQQIGVHVSNSGRLRELLMPGAKVLLRPAGKALRATSYDLILVEKDGSWVCVDASYPPRLIRQTWGAGRLSPFSCYDRLRGEVKVGNSRLDLLFEGPGEACCWVESKSVTLVRGGVALFPDAPSQRGRKHLEELAGLAIRGLCAGVIFIIQREDAAAFRPNDEMDPDFGRALRRAQEAGVRMYAYRCQVSPRGIALTDELPIILS